MCFSILYKTKEIDGQKEFVETFGRENLIFRNPYNSEPDKDYVPTYEPDHCLCWLDLDAVTEKLNLTHHPDENYMDIIFEPKLLSD